MRVPTTLRRLASMASVTVALGALAAACSLSSSSASSLVSSASSHLESAKTYDIDISIKAPGALLFAHELHVEVDAPRHLELVTFHIGSLPLRVLFTPSHAYLQGPNSPTSTSFSTTWYELPGKGFVPFIISGSDLNTVPLLDSVINPKLDGYAFVNDQTCRLVTASISSTSFNKLSGNEKSLHVSSSGTFSVSVSASATVPKNGKVLVDVAVSLAGYPLRIVEHVNVGRFHEVTTEVFSNFGASQHITVPSPSHIKPISSAQIGELFSGLIMG